MRAFLVALAFLIFPSVCPAADPATKAPDWLRTEISRLSAGGGRWVADNSAYKSENEPFEAYSTEWRSSFDGDAMSGRLFGFRDGVQTKADFWEFRQYWHPGRQEAVLEQFGWGGAFGSGGLVEDGAGTKADQTFYRPDGSTARTGHKSWFEDDDTYVTESFDIIDGAWKPHRKYVWKRQPADKK